MTSLQNIPPRGVAEVRSYREHEMLVASSMGSGRGPESEPLIDLNLVRDLLKFALHACRRHKKAALSVVGAFVLAAALSQLILSKKYYTEAKLLADRNVVMPLLGNPGRRMSDEADTPTRLAPEMILTRENLEKVIETTDLLRSTERKQSQMGRIRSRIRETLQGPLTPAERLEEFVWRLRSSMNVAVADGTVVIGTVWSDPDDALKIVSATQDLFLKERQAQEVSLVAGSISILEQRALDVQKDITAMLDTLSKQRVALTPDEMRLFPSTSRVSTYQGPSAELVVAQSRLEATSRALTDAEQFRNRRLAELQATLSEQQNVYGPAHPLVENTAQSIRVLQSEPAELAQLRREVEEQRMAVARLTRSSGGGGGNGADESLAAAALRNFATVRVDSIVQEKQQYGRSRLRIALSSYQALLERLEAARIELLTVRATFQFKYGVLIPATVPKQPMGTSAAIIIAVATIVGCALAVMTAIALDLASGRVLEPWQIGRVIGLPVLGEAATT